MKKSASPGAAWPARATWARLALAMLLALLLLQLLSGIRLLTATYDETTHLPAGYSYWKTGEFRLNPQHPPLIKLLCALPLLVIGPEAPFDEPAWLADPPDEWTFGFRTLYGNDADRLLFWGRLPNALLALLLASYVYRWARDLFGLAAGLVALTLCAFSPTLVAHARFVTFDAGLACFSTIALYHLWRYLRNRARRHLVLSGLGLGCALASKFSGLVLLIAVPLLLLAAALRPEPDARDTRRERALGARLLRAAAVGLVLLLLAALVVQASYLLRSDLLLYGKGVALVNADHDPSYPFYLMGQFKEGGWWYYFLVAFLIKTPVPTLVLLALTIAFFRRFRTERNVDELCLIVPVVLYTAVTSAFADNLGIRYLLPIYPLLFVFVSRLARSLSRGALPRVVGALLAAWYVTAAIGIHPDQLAFFNRLVGGPSRGHLYLDDSNISWAQDLKRLKRHVDATNLSRIKLRYGRNTAPGYYSIPWQPITDREWAGDPPPGIYGFDTHLLIRGEYYAREHGVKTDWLSRYEPIDRIGYSCYLFEFR